MDEESTAPGASASRRAPGHPPTARGRATYDRIVGAAAALVYEHGVAGTSLDDVRAATATSKSQLYHYFSDKAALICAVIQWQQGAVLRGQEPFLSEFASLAELRQWRDHLVAINDGLLAYGGCPIGGVASEVATVEESARRVSADAFRAWQGGLQRGIERIIETGEIAPDADAESLAVGLLAAVQGGLLLSKVTQSVEPLRISLDHALAAVEAQAVAA